MYRVVVPRLLLLGRACAGLADAQPLSIPVESSSPPVCKDRGDGLCATIVHVQDPAIGQVPFSSVDDALGSLEPDLVTPADRRCAHQPDRFRWSTSRTTARRHRRLLRRRPSWDFPYAPATTPAPRPQATIRNFAVRLRGYINVDAEGSPICNRTIGLFADDGACGLQIGGATGHHARCRSAALKSACAGPRAASARSPSYGAAGVWAAPSSLSLVTYQNGSNAVLGSRSPASGSLENDEHGCKLTNLHDLGFTLIGAPRPNLFVNTELYTARAGSAPRASSAGTMPAAAKATTASATLAPPCPTACVRSATSPRTAVPTVAPAMPRARSVTRAAACSASPIATAPPAIAATSAADAARRRCRTGATSVAAAPARGRSLPAGLLGVSLTLVALALLRARRRRRQLGLLLGLGLLLVPLPSRAELAVNTQTFHPAIGAENIITVEGSRTGSACDRSWSALIEYAHRPLRLLDNSTGNTLAETIRPSPRCT